ncbi:MAG: hypothetical protein J6K53_07375 [Roseburia sp.]|nr:hypothetical protein [Roseburia sp.]
MLRTDAMLKRKKLRRKRRYIKGTGDRFLCAVVIFCLLGQTVSYAGTEEKNTRENTTAHVAAYDDIIERTYQSILAEKHPHDLDWRNQGTDFMEERCECLGTEEALSVIGYMLYDVDGNGTEELLIVDKETSDFHNMVLFMYTFRDGRPVLVFSSMAEDRFYILNDNTIYNASSGTPAATGYGTYRIAEDGIRLSPIDYYFTYLYYPKDPDELPQLRWYHNTTGEYNTEKSELLPKEDWEIEEIEEMEAQIKDLDVTYFSDYEAEHVTYMKKRRIGKN